MPLAMFPDTFDASVLHISHRSKEGDGEGHNVNCMHGQMTRRTRDLTSAKRTQFCQNVIFGSELFVCSNAPFKMAKKKFRSMK